jgi:hypothetical protein
VSGLRPGAAIELSKRHADAAGGLLEGRGKIMRHVKIGPGPDCDAAALRNSFALRRQIEHDCAV